MAVAVVVELAVVMAMAEAMAIVVGVGVVDSFLIAVAMLPTFSRLSPSLAVSSECTYACTCACEGACESACACVCAYCGVCVVSLRSPAACSVCNRSTSHRQTQPLPQPALLLPSLQYPAQLFSFLSCPP